MKKTIIYLLIMINMNMLNSICIQGDNCPVNQGYCLNDQCICINNYWTHNKPTQTSPMIYCNYKRTSTLMCFIAEFFLPPFGNYLAGYFGYATLKLPITIIALCVIRAKNLGQIKNIGVLLFLALNMFTFIIMQLFDIYNYLFGYYTDSEGVPMY